jgi:hypothetical protein
VRADRPRPAFYALAPGGWRDYVTLLHLPYTAWHLAYVAIGAGLAPVLDTGRLVASLVAFGLAVGVAAHCLDELHGRPLRTAVPDRALVVLAAGALGGAIVIGVAALDETGPGLAIFVAVGAIAVPAYNLELLGGRLHNDAGFALLWGAFPVLAGFFAQSGTLTLAAVAAALAATALSLAQRRLSTAVRRRRRDPVDPAGPGDPAVAVPEAALRALTAAVILLAVAVVAA